MSQQVTLKLTNVTLTQTTDTVQVTRTVPEVVIAGVSGPVGPAFSGYYGSFTDSTTQTITADTAKAVTFDTTEESDGVTIGTPSSRIVITNAGTYNIQFSLQLDKTDGGQDDATIWLRINGQDVPRTATDVTLEQSARRIVAAWNFVYTFTAGQYFELVWSSHDPSMRLKSEVTRTGPIRPAVPSAILTVCQVQ
jgi:hypothetical protein